MTRQKRRQKKGFGCGFNEVEHENRQDDERKMRFLTPESDEKAPEENRVGAQEDQIEAASPEVPELIDP